ncbi:4'-phosphopantetheinyl transferase superfamily protein [Bifidobacterium pullorum subsp. saeculare]|uniref:Holo-[acyl-carrier-protein] synthase n=1 Tax=Bifidobacterium pullorum subsp. saeculare TaxID=78257 RepID=A0A938X0B1_9BIFI|nr:4'-phosphopantetheinyl transferase superfamily protein [Bifidobacterium pullorum]MBM6700343.1 4'-phosphopantetheinyl transferase superfamily protein [Bifidobacterium pullorum subsp. saeculare]
MGILGLGHDVVDVAAFTAQLTEPGTRMRGLFSVRELRQATARAQAKHDGEAVHLAAKWAGKEATLKAWEAALGDLPSPYTLDDFPWSRIEILDDSRGRPHIRLANDVTRTLLASLPQYGPAAAGAPPAAGPVSPVGPAAISPAAALRAARPSPPAASASRAPSWQVSLSHDGPVASAVVILAD